MVLIFATGPYAFAGRLPDCRCGKGCGGSPPKLARIHGYERRMWHDSQIRWGSKESPGALSCVVKNDCPTKTVAGLVFEVENEECARSFLINEQCDEDEFVGEIYNIFAVTGCGEIIEALTYRCARSEDPKSLMDVVSAVAVAAGELENIAYFSDMVRFVEKNCDVDDYIRMLVYAINIKRVGGVFRSSR